MKENEIKPAGRYRLLDTIRGIAVFNMIWYHALWDMVYIFGFYMPWYLGMGAYIWQQAICWTFILVSGMCSYMSGNGIKRGAFVTGCGFLISLFLYVFSPQTPNLFGVLVLLGCSMMAVSRLKPHLLRLDGKRGAPLCFAAFLITRYVSRGYLGMGLFKIYLPQSLYSGYISAFLGFPPSWFHSTDYFPMIPWIFLFLTGFYIMEAAALDKRAQRLLRMGDLPALGFIGRHSLFIYMAHQPVIYLILSAASNIIYAF